jgi:hypothetical protein
MGTEVVVYALMAAGTVASVVGQQQQAKQQQKMYEDQAQQTANQAAYEKDAARARAEKIRKMGKAQQGEAKAALAASGVKLGEGTALEVQKDIGQRAEEDALTAILQGDRYQQSADAEIDMLGKAGSNARSNANMSSVGTILSSASTVGSNWKRAS